MENHMADNNPYAEYSSTKLYMDATGKGAKIAEPIANPANSAVARQTGAPMTGAANQLQDDYLESLFNGENLSEEFKLKAETIFQAAINEKVAIIENNILDAAKEIIQENAQNQQNSLVEHVDGYLNYVISEWMEENKIAIERGLRTEIAENFIHGLKSLFETSFIDVPAEKYNILDDLYEANEELQKNANNLIKENIQLKNEITARLCAEAFMEEAAGLADTQIEKLAKLSEGIEFTNVNHYREKVSLLKESYFGQRMSSTPETTYYTPQSAGQMLTEDSSYVSAETSDSAMNNIVNAITAINKNRPARPALKSPSDSLVNTRIQSIMNPNMGLSPKDNLF